MDFLKLDSRHLAECTKNAPNFSEKWQSLSSVTGHANPVPKWYILLRCSKKLGDHLCACAVKLTRSAAYSKVYYLNPGAWAWHFVKFEDPKSWYVIKPSSFLPQSLNNHFEAVKSRWKVPTCRLRTRPRQKIRFQLLYHLSMMKTNLSLDSKPVWTLRSQTLLLDDDNRTFLLLPQEYWWNLLLSFEIQL